MQAARPVSAFSAITGDKRKTFDASYQSLLASGQDAATAMNTVRGQVDSAMTEYGASGQKYVNVGKNIQKQTRGLYDASINGGMTPEEAEKRVANQFWAVNNARSGVRDLQRGADGQVLADQASTYAYQEAAGLSPYAKKRAKAYQKSYEGLVLGGADVNAADDQVRTQVLNENAAWAQAKIDRYRKQHPNKAVPDKYTTALATSQKGLADMTARQGRFAATASSAAAAKVAEAAAKKQAFEADEAANAKAWGY
jgi:hypothetical protein